jgi:hypothetical protein
VVGGRLCLPDQIQNLQRLGYDLAALAEVPTDRSQLVLAVAYPDAQKRSPARNLVERRQRLGNVERVIGR